MFDFLFFFNSLLIGIGLAMDAFSVSLANGLADRDMKTGRMSLIAGTFAGFQFAMPMIGWVMVHTAASRLSWFEKLVPWIALGLLLYIGGKMLKEGLSKKEEEETSEFLSAPDLAIQGVATSIDALSVGFTIAHYNGLMAVACALLIAIVTFFICMGGLYIGKTFGTRLANKSSIFGGVILIGIGFWIFFS